MAKGNILYSVVAGNRLTGYHYIYETTKREKADKYVADLMRGANDYDKIYIDKSFVNKYDKRNQDWED